MHSDLCHWTGSLSVHSGTVMLGHFLVYSRLQQCVVGGEMENEILPGHMMAEDTGGQQL